MTLLACETKAIDLRPGLRPRPHGFVLPVTLFQESFTVPFYKPLKRLLPLKLSHRFI